jgi:hypothetical protein
VVFIQLTRLTFSRPVDVSPCIDARKGRSFAPIIAVLVIVSGVTAGILLRREQGTAPEQQSTEEKRDGLDAHAQDAASSAALGLTILAHRHSIRLGAEDIDDTVEAPSIAVSDSGVVYVAWATKTGELERALMMSRSEDGGRTWGEPWRALSSPIHVTFSQMHGRRIERKTRLSPLLATHGEKVYLSWVRGGAERSDVTMLLATSDDKGASFSEPIRVHQSNQARPTFASMTVSPEGDVACAWLDNRNEVQQCFMAVKPKDQAEFLPEMLVDPGQNLQGICPCCPTAVAFAHDQSVWIAYRGHVDGMRDIWAAKWRPGDDKPSMPMRTNKPTWQFDGCPHDGPAIIPMDGKAAIAWMDAHQGMSRVFVNQLASNDNAEWTCNQANPIDGGFEGTQQQPCMIVDRLRSSARPVVHAAWSATGAAGGLGPHQGHGPPTTSPAGSRRAIHYAVSHDGGVTFGPSTAVAPKDGVFQSRVKLAVAPEGGVYMAYFELSTEGKQLVVGRVNQTTSLAKTDASIAGVGP